MKTIFVIHSLNIGGAEKILVQLLQSLDRSQFQPELVVFARGGGFENNIPADVPLTCLHSRGRLASIPATLRLAKLLKRKKPHCVISFMWGINMVVLAAAWLSGTNARVVVSERTHLGSGILRYSCPRLRRFLIRKLYRRADRIITISNGVAQNLIDEFSVTPSKISVIYNGVNIDEIQRRKIEPAVSYSDKPYIIGVGRLHPLKNFSLLLRSFARITKTKNNINLLILGKGEQRSVLEGLIGHLGLKGRVFMPGLLNNPYPCISGAEVFVLTSLFEGFPNVIIEAMACKVPVVCVPYAGVNEIIEDNKTGLLSPGYGEDMLSGTVNKLLDDPALHEKLVENAHKRVVEKFSIHEMINRYGELLI